MDEQAEMLMNLLVVGGFALGLAWVVSISLGGQKPKKRCSPHRWSHHPQTGKLTCTECAYEAGKTEPEEY